MATHVSGPCLLLRARNGLDSLPCAGAPRPLAIALGGGIPVLRALTQVLCFMRAVVTGNWSVGSFVGRYWSPAGDEVGP